MRLDLLVWGATGFTGRLVAEYLVKTYGTDRFAWGLGGRSEEKLRALRADLAALRPGAEALPLVVGDALDVKAMERVASQARVIATTAGPFSLHGRALIGACARAGTHYCDLTGEPTFVREAIDLHHATAQRTSARLVPCSGFDSVPSDLGVWLLSSAFAARGTRLARAKLFVTAMRGGFSGGTVASAMLLASQAARDARVRALLEDPYALDPGGRARGEGPPARSARFDADLGAWVAPFVMGAINERVVRRTNALLDYAYGEDFRYGEWVRTGRGVTGRARALGMAAGMRVAERVFAVDTLSSALTRTVLPAPGEGPSAAQRARGHFTMRVFGEALSGETLWATVSAKGDPGYAATACMLSEVALALSRAGDEALPARAGVLTPATALGGALVARLRAAGMTLAVGETDGVPAA